MTNALLCIIAGSLTITASKQVSFGYDRIAGAIGVILVIAGTVGVVVEAIVGML